ncbi:hypothetical protein D9M68_499240 [compost metagenome]
MIADQDWHAAPRLSNSYAKLPERFFERLSPRPVPAPKCVVLNEGLALDLGLDLDFLSSTAGTSMLAGNAFPISAEPIATAYAGHQFGTFVQELGDGRVTLLGDVLDSNGRRREIQLKGSGRTKYSRAGDGRAGLGPVLREYVFCEALAALGLPTTRALGVVTHEEPIFRETILKGAVLARVAATNVRIGTFEYFAARGDVEALEHLAAYVLEHLHQGRATGYRSGLALLEAVIAKQAELAAGWMLVGFVHGAMNTDNVSVSGETIDFGPSAFMDDYRPDAVFSSIDSAGRYAYGNQPRVMLWNLARLAGALLPLIHSTRDHAIELAQEALASFPFRYERAFYTGFRSKLGLIEREEGDIRLITDLLDLMAATSADFTQTFRNLSSQVVSPSEDPGSDLELWIARWLERLGRETADFSEIQRRMLATNPKFIPRNHQVEAAVRAAVDRDDYDPFRSLVAVISRPFDEQPGREHYAHPPMTEERIIQTFCGT